jgi:hypothetical protein
MKTHCQANEYEIIARYLELIGRLDKPTFIDIGAGDGYRLSNTRDLIERHGATGLMIDADPQGNPDVVKAFVTVENITDLLEGHDDPDFLSIDIDGNDYWILEALLQRDMPSLIMAEVNTRFHSADESFTVPYNPARTWNNDDHFGMSFGAFRKLMEANGYTVVHMEGINALAMRDDLVTPDTPIDIRYAYSFGHAPNNFAPWVAV